MVLRESARLFARSCPITSLSWGITGLAALIDDTRKAGEIDVDKLDAIVVAGGQSPMFTLESAIDVQRKFVEFYEVGKIACALCHGVAILRYSRLSNGQLLAKGKTVTGFANVEEDFADNAVWEANLLSREKHVMAWRIEDEMKRIGLRQGRVLEFRQLAGGACDSRSESNEKPPRKFARGLSFPELRRLDLN